MTQEHGETEPALRPKHRYSLLSKLGEGGMGDVYLAEQKGNGRRVAMKILKAEFARDPLTVERFLREAQATGQIGHENVVEILDVGRSRSGQVFFVMEVLEGQELGDVLHREHRLPWARAKPILLQICAALAAAHDKGVIHRDMKPDNVFLLERDGRQDVVKILDFGIAKVEGAQALTQAGMVFGTAGYMAPEQVMATTVDGRTDVYAVACMAFEMLTGMLPFRDRAAMKVLNMHLREPAPSMCQLAPDAGIPAAVDAVILRAMAKKADDRFADMRAFGRALEAIPAGPLPATSNAPGAATTPSAGAAPKARQSTQVHVGPAPISAPPGMRPLRPGQPRQAQSTVLMTQPPPEIPTVDPGVSAAVSEPISDVAPDLPEVDPELLQTLVPTEAPAEAPVTPAEKRAPPPPPPRVIVPANLAVPSIIDDDDSERITLIPTKRPNRSPGGSKTTGRRPQATAMMTRPPLPTIPEPSAEPTAADTLPPTPIVDPEPPNTAPAAVDAQALAYLFLGLANTVAGTPATVPMDTLVKHVHGWVREQAPALTRAATLETWQALMMLPDEAQRRNRVLDEVHKLATMPRARIIDLANELYEIAGRVGPVVASAHHFIVAVMTRLGLDRDPQLHPQVRAIAYLHMTLAHGPERLDARELRELRDMLPRWAPGASTHELELLIRWALAEFEHRPTMQDRWQHAYALADKLTESVDLDEARAVMADLRAIADADGYIDARERELLGEMSKRFAALAGL
ncbi:MAG: protein kinase [Myxococcales bacterium]|nr:protein kinase [Myxococcales bacterium]